jgi:hypothetical protein
MTGGIAGLSAIMPQSAAAFAAANLENLPKPPNIPRT